MHSSTMVFGNKSLFPLKDGFYNDWNFSKLYLLIMNMLKISDSPTEEWQSSLDVVVDVVSSINRIVEILNTSFCHDTGVVGPKLASAPSAKYVLDAKSEGCCMPLL